jgi:hypothetical protein
VQLLQRAAERAGLGKQRAVILAQQIQGRLAELQEFGGIAGAAVVLLDLSLFLRQQAGGGDFVDLEAKQIKLLRVGLFIDDERGLLGLDGSLAADQPGKRFPFGIEAAERVEDGELFGRMQQRLMLVRAVDIDQRLTEGGENAERSGRTVDELPIGA